MSPRPAKPTALTFEQAIARLEEIDALINNPATGLEETIALTEEGLKLIRSGHKLLKEAELKIQQLEAPAGETAKAGQTHSDTDNDNEFSLL